MTGLQPLPYHVDVADRLQAREPASWQAFAAAPDADADALHGDLARSAYRLDPQAHPRLGLALGAAVAALGVEVPVTVHQLEGVSAANAGVLHRRDQVVITLGGDLLDRLTDPELTALLGHELAHHRLWTLDGGRFGVADRLLDALAADARTPEPFLETARRWSLATELFADRGALAACGVLEVAVSCLVKVATGLREVDVAGYLRQAETAVPALGSHGRTHPETVLRAWALERWRHERTEDAAVTLLRPGLDLDRLDLADRQALEQLTRELIEAYLAPDWLRSELVTAHARQFFADLRPGGPPPAPLAADVPAPTRRYLGYVLLDLATADPDLEDQPLAAARELAASLGFGQSFAELVGTELAGTELAGTRAAR